MHRQWQSGLVVTKQHSGAVASSEHKTHSVMIEAGITSRNVSSRAPLTSSLEMLGHAMK